MSRRKNVKGRPVGANQQIVNKAGSTYVYLKPFFQSGAWRCRRRHRVTGDLSCITLEAENFSDAYAEVTARADAEVEAASQSALPVTERAIIPITLKDFWPVWKKHLKEFQEVGNAVLKQSASEGNVLMKAFGADRRLDSISDTDIYNFFTSIGSTRSGRTKLAYHSTLRRAFKLAVTLKHARLNPVDSFEVPPAWSKQAGEAAKETGQALTADEARKLLRLAGEVFEVDCSPIKFQERVDGVENVKTEIKPPRHLRLAVAMALLAGLRKGNIARGSRPKKADGSEDFESAAVRWGDLCLEQGKETILINKKRMKSRQEFFAPLNCELADLLREEAARILKTTRKPPKPTDTVIPVVDLKKPWEGLVKRSGLSVRNFRFHDLRHTFSSALAATAPYAVLKRLMGHSVNSGDVTARYANHIEIEILRVELNKLPRLFTSTTVKAEAAS